jgi:hypothetical protein
MITICALLVTLAADPAPAPKDSSTPRNPNPLAPSLPELTDKEEAELDRIIDQFIAADTGKLRGPEAKKAIDEFKQLGPEATFALLRGFNKSAHIDHSCPALTISRKLTSILRSSDDVKLLMYAKENIGVGVKKTRYRDIIDELKSGCTQRITALKNAPNPEIRNRPKLQ